MFTGRIASAFLSSFTCNIFISILVDIRFSVPDNKLAIVLVLKLDNLLVLAALQNFITNVEKILFLYALCCFVCNQRIIFFFLSFFLELLYRN